MELTLLAVFAALLLALNAFFVLAEFAVVKVRPSRVAELQASGDPRADVLAHIQAHLDDTLSVCQVGITLASVALGMVGKRATDAILGDSDQDMLRTVLAFTVSYVLVSGSHIVLGELVPKSIAIRIADRAALACARPLRFFHKLFFPALWVLTAMANGVLRLFGMGGMTGEAPHSEGELRMLLDESQERGMMSFRRLLFIENVFDFGELCARDAMRPRSSVRCLMASSPWEQNRRVLTSSRYTRYPLIVDDPERPVGLLHVKDLVLRGEGSELDLRAIARPILHTTVGTPLEALLAEMQRRRIHAALVMDAEGQWTGFVTLEDVIEELVGTIHDEFEEEDPVQLSDTISLGSVHLGIEAESIIGAVSAALGRAPEGSLPLPAEAILAAVNARELLVSSYLGEGVGMPHARIPGLARPHVMVLRSEVGVPCEGTTERSHLLFVVLTPAGQPRVHQRLQSIIASLLHDSDYVKERLLSAESAEEVLEVIRTGEQASLD